MTRAPGRDERSRWVGIKTISMGVLQEGAEYGLDGCTYSNAVTTGSDIYRLSSHHPRLRGVVRTSNENRSNKGSGHEKVRRGQNHQSVSCASAAWLYAIDAWMSLYCFSSSSETPFKFSDARLFCYKRIHEGGKARKG